MSERPRTGSRIGRALWLTGLVVALGASVIWWRVGRGPRSARHGGADDRVAEVADPIGYVKSRTGKEDAASVKDLVTAYGEWAQRPDAMEARKLALHALLAQPSVKVAVESVLLAVENDPTPRAMDPMWPSLVKGMASLWDAITFQFGRDRIYLETRDKPRDLVLASMAEVAQSGNAKLTADQRQMLASDLIDLYPRLKPEQKPEVDRALHAMVGSDIVDILNGRGGKDLKIVSQQQQAMDKILHGGK